VWVAILHAKRTTPGRTPVNVPVYRGVPVEVRAADHRAAFVIEPYTKDSPVLEPPESVTEDYKHQRNKEVWEAVAKRFEAESWSPPNPKLFFALRDPATGWRQRGEAMRR